MLVDKVQELVVHRFGLFGRTLYTPLPYVKKGQMLQLWGEMLKAMGDVMINHGQAMQAVGEGR
jgi:hypothetical protein